MGASCRRVRDGVTRGRRPDAVVLRHSAGIAVCRRRRARIAARAGRCRRVLSHLRACVNAAALVAVSADRMGVVRNRHRGDVPRACWADRRFCHRSGGAVGRACVLALTWAELAKRASLAEAFGGRGRRFEVGPADAHVVCGSVGVHAHVSR